MSIFRSTLHLRSTLTATRSSPSTPQTTVVSASRTFTSRPTVLVPSPSPRTSLSTHSIFNPKFQPSQFVSLRAYASKATKDKLKSTSTLVPGSKQPITDETAQQEYSKVESTMATAVDWFRKECNALESRANGRVTPALLDPVRVNLPGADGGANWVRLEEVATVGVKDGSTLIITVFDDANLKYVEQGIYDSKVSGVVPQKHDTRTIKIPIPRPTVEAKLQLYATTQRKAEEIRVQIRKQHQASIKRGKYEKYSIESQEFQKLTDKHIKDVDNILANLKKVVGAK